MKTLAERHQARAERKLDNQGEDSVRSDEDAGLGRAGIGVVNLDIVQAGGTDGFGGGTDSGAAGGGWPKAGEGNGGGTVEGGQGGGTDPLATLDTLTAHLGSVTDVAEVDRLLALENGTDGKKRAGAISALEARKTALTAS